VLHDVQKMFGHVSEEAMREIAQALNLTRAEVYGVVSFYHDFRKEVEPRPVLKLCRVRSMQSTWRRSFGSGRRQPKPHKSGAIYCLGLCSVGPAAMVGDKSLRPTGRPAAENIVGACENSYI
jgi:formate dehydrogenase subunit gamma